MAAQVRYGSYRKKEVFMHVTDVDFAKYYASCSLCPSQWVKESLSQYSGPRRLAVDLGAGTLRDSFYLSREGFLSVLAVDASPQVHTFAELLGDSRITAREWPIQEFTLARASVDFCISMRTLWFLPPEEVCKVFENVLGFLRPGGMFAFNILRKRIPINPRKWFTLSELELSILIRQWDILDAVPREIDQPLSGTQCSVHWSTLDVCVQKP